MAAELGLKVHRVLDAARVLDAFFTDNPGSIVSALAIEVSNVRGTVRALDAPVERYEIIESSLENTWTHAILDSHDRNKRAVAWCETRESADCVLAALNAQERAK